MDDATAPAPATAAAAAAAAATDLDGASAKVEAMDIDEKKVEGEVERQPSAEEGASTAPGDEAPPAAETVADNAAAAAAAAAAAVDGASLPAAAADDGMDEDKEGEEDAAPAAAAAPSSPAAETGTDEKKKKHAAKAEAEDEEMEEEEEGAPPPNQAPPPSADGVVDAAAAAAANSIAAAALDESTDETEDLEIDDVLNDDDDDDDDKDTPPGDATETLLLSMSKKEDGNEAFKSGDYDNAIRSYRRGVTLLKAHNKNNTGDPQVQSLLVTLQTNLSMVYAKQDKYRQSRDLAGAALKIDPSSVKALYRRAVAYRHLGDAESARDDLKAAIKLEPNNRAVRAELVAVKKEVEASRAHEKKRLQKAFSAKSSSFLYDDKEAEERRKIEERKKREAEEAAAKEKRKIEWEDDCVQRMANNEEAISFEDWEKERKAKVEAEDKARKKARKEEEERKKAERKAAQDAARAAASANSEDVVKDEDNDLTEKELAMMRGYKKTKDGRTTSYFTREVSDEERALLEKAQAGPQRIGSSTTPTPTSTSPLPTAAAAGGAAASASPGAASAPAMVPTVPSPTSSGTATAASAWNQAGTWEERDTTEWCTSCLRRHLTSAAVEVDSTTYSAKITDVTNLTGDASVVSVRGRKRYVFDYHLSVQFDVVAHVVAEGQVNADDIDEDDADEVSPTKETEAVVVASGTLKLPDINSTVTIDELEIEPVSGWKTAPSDEHAAGVTECRGILVEAVREKVRSFVAEFNAQY